MNKALLLVAMFLASLSSPLLVPALGESPEEMGVLHTAVNPSNNNTYHLLTSSSWEDAASYAQSLGGFLVTVDDATENSWIVDTFSTWNNQSRHLWIGLSDGSEEGQYKWHDGTPFLYRNWGEAQPSEGGDEDYVHIAGTNMGNIDPGTWNDLENDPQYFPVYGVVEIGPGADYALRFDGEEDHIVIEHDPALDFTNETALRISAWVQPYSLSGNQFIVMKGDYGWGLYLKDDHVAFSSAYSLAQHPVSNGTVSMDTWSHVEVVVTVGEGYAFFINGAEAGTIVDEDAALPLGDFGSNDCYETGQDCDELYIARMGAGCECAYFEGLLDNISIQSGTSTSNMIERSSWMFGEGEGSTTHDDADNRSGSIIGADWVMPDGSIVAQAVELFMGEEIYIEDASEGDTLLFFAEVEQYTRSLSWFSSSWSFDEWEEESESALNVFVGFNFMPDRWNHNDSFTDEFGWAYEEWSWPEDGTVWFVVVMERDVGELYLYLDADVADPPPTLDDMTELKDSIAITGQEVVTNFDSSDFGTAYYYVNVTEPLADLRVRTYGGRGNIDIGISYYSPPTPDDWWDIGFEIDEDGDDVKVEEPSKVQWSTGPGNDEEVHLFDVEPGLYYITAYTFRNARGFTIVADFVYPPLNIEPEDAITLTPSVEYGPLSGYANLMQFFKVEVPQDTERLIVDLSDGGGEASLYMRHEQAPTTTTYDHHSAAEGADDRIAFNDPTPGWWYILLTTESAFTGVNIVAEFADRYVWEYDGVPIELFNGEPLDGVSVGKGGEISFYAMLEEPGNFFQIETYGGSGDVQLLVEGLQYEVEFGDWGRPEPGGGLDLETSQATIKSGSSGTNHVVTMDAPMNGRVEISLIGVSDAEEVSMVARWDRSDLPIDPVEPEEPSSATPCEEVAKVMFSKLDRDANGLLESFEIDSIDASVANREGMDVNEDDAIEYREYLQFKCTCDVELGSVFDEFSQGRNEVTLSALEEHPWANSYDFEAMDGNKDEMIDRDEFELLVLLCETSFNAFDGDGDGVPDEDDAFPDDPTETKDTDGDGVGDNADIVASVSNDIIYATAGLLFVMLLGLLFAFARGGSKQPDVDKHWDASERMEETLLAGFGSEDPIPAEPLMDEPLTSELDAAPEAIQLPSAAIEAPNEALMGMILDGVETIEHPTGSGQLWVRSEPDQAWERKA